MMITMLIASGIAIVVATVVQNSASSVLQEKIGRSRNDLATQIRRVIMSPTQIMVSARQAGVAGVPIGNQTLLDCLGNATPCNTATAPDFWLFEQITAGGTIEKVGGDATEPKFYSVVGDACDNTVVAPDGRCRLRVRVAFQALCPSADGVNPAVPGITCTGTPAELIQVTATIDDATPAGVRVASKTAQAAQVVITSELLTCKIRATDTVPVGSGGLSNLLPCQ